MSYTERAFIPAARPMIGQDEIEAAIRVLQSGHVVQGQEVAAFEREFSEFVAGRHCVAVNSGTSALQLALMALNIGVGDEVVVPSFSFPATANAVRLVGAEPIFADIEADSFNVEPKAVEAAITWRTVAIMPVHLYGHPAAMDRLMDIADRYGLAVVEDAAQAHGAVFGRHPVGAWGSAGCFSFYPTKNMHALEGGMITTEDSGMARTLRLLRNQGMTDQRVTETVGAGLRMTEVSAAVGRVQLKKLPHWTEERRKHASWFDSALTGVTTPPVADGARHVYNQYTIRVHDNRDAARDALAVRMVGSAVHYPIPIHRLAPYWNRLRQYSNQRIPDLRETERASREVLSLPVYPGLSQEELERIAESINGLRRA